MNTHTEIEKLVDLLSDRLRGLGNDLFESERSRAVAFVDQYDELQVAKGLLSICRDTLCGSLNASIKDLVCQIDKFLEK